MTNEEIRIAIAEACGLKFVRAGHIKMPGAQEMWPDHWQDTRGKRKRIDGSIVGIPVALPDYPECLNAMHGAENRIHNSKDAPAFARHLMKVVCGYTTDEDVISINGWVLYRIAHATARQRAEAFLRTLNLWRD